MSSYNYLHVHQSEGVAFDDIAALNAELEEKTCIAELVEFDNPVKPGSGFVGFINQLPDGQVVITSKGEDFDFTKYATDFVLVWGCWGPDIQSIIANHMTAGKLVFRYEQEGGWPDQYAVLTPNKVENHSQKELTF